MGGAVRRISLVASIAGALLVAATASAATGELTPNGCIDDATDGRSVCPTHTNGLSGPRAIAMSSDGSSIYVASAKDSAVAAFDREPITGALTAAGCVNDVDATAESCAQSTPGLEGAHGVEVSGDGRSVYVVGTRAIVQFDRNTTTGAITPVDCIGPSPCAESVPGLIGAKDVVLNSAGQSVYVVASGNDAIVTFRRFADGSLKSRGCIQDVDVAHPLCDGSADGLDGATSVAISPNNKSIYVASIVDDAIVRFDREGDGSLTDRGCIQDVDSDHTSCNRSMPGLRLPLSVAVSPDSRSVYAAGHLDQAITQLARNTTTGALAPVGCIAGPTGGDPCATTSPTLAFPAAILISPDSTSAYVASGGGRAVMQFDRSRRGGALTYADCIKDPTAPAQTSCAQSTRGLNQPNAFAISPDGKFVYATSRSNAIVTFTRQTGP